MNGSPLYRDTLAFCGVLLEELAATPLEGLEPLGRRLAEGALRLLDDVALALAGMERRERLEDADAELCTLRHHLLLAGELTLLGEEAFLGLAEQADTIGRQLGGWQKKLRRGDPR